MPDFEAMFRLDENAIELFLHNDHLLGPHLRDSHRRRREAGTLELTELLLIVLIADGVRSGMGGDYSSVTGAIIIAGTLLGWNALLSWLSFNPSFVRDVLRPKPLALIEDGRYLRKHMRQEMVTKDELDSLLRVHGIEDAADVKSACLEPDGQLSVIKSDGGGSSDALKKKSAL